MTFPEDKLPALSEIAAEVQQATGSEYLASLWRDSLIPGLMWTRLYNSKFGNKFFTSAKVDSAPSWSWASYDGIIKYDTDLFKPKSEVKWLYLDEDDKSTPAPQDLVTILDARTTLLDGSYPLGRVTGGKLTLRGPCRDFSYSQFLNEKKGKNSAIITNEHHAVLFPTSVFGLDPSDSWKDNDQLTCLLCRMCPTQTWHLGEDGPSHTIFDLILRLTDAQHGVYQRVGCGCGSGKVNANGDEFKDWAPQTLHII